MKTEKEIRKLLEDVNTNLPKSKYPAMTYEQGVEEALLWALGDVPDEEFVVNFIGG